MYADYICLVDAFLAGSRWMEQQKEEELGVLRRDKDMTYMSYKAIQEQLKELKDVDTK
jgi:hypothetical protein